MDTYNPAIIFTRARWASIVIFRSQQGSASKIFRKHNSNILAPALSLSAWNRFFKELTVAQLDKSFPVTQGTWKFIIVLITLHHLLSPKLLMRFTHHNHFLWDMLWYCPHINT